jgi:transposase
MKALQIADARTLSIAVRQALRRSAESRYDQRLHAVLLVCQGQSCAAVGAWLGAHPATVQRWVHRVAARGLGGLRDGARAGRPRRLPAAAWAKVAQDLRRPPRDLGYDQNGWDGQLLARHLYRQYELRLGPRQCQRLLQARPAGTL